MFETTALYENIPDSSVKHMDFSLSSEAKSDRFNPIASSITSVYSGDVLMRLYAHKNPISCMLCNNFVNGCLV